MNSYIERISLCSLVIFILIISHFETDNSKPMVFASSSLLNYNTENSIDNAEYSITKPSIDNYATNNTQYINQTSNVNSSNTTVEEKETKLSIKSNDIDVPNNTLVYNENQQSHLGSEESGPNNNNQFEENNTNLIEPDNTVTVENSTLNNNSEKELNLVTEVRQITSQLAKAPAPPGGGEDPFAVPIDDFYGIFLVLGVSIIFGIARVRKLKSLKSVCKI